MKLKICGMKYPENILEVAALLPDYMGFIFWEKSSRYFDGEIPAGAKHDLKVEAKDHVGNTSSFSCSFVY